MGSLFTKQNLTWVRSRIISTFYILTPISFFLPLRFFNVVIISFFILAASFFFRWSMFKINKRDFFIITVPFFIFIYGLLIDINQGHTKEGLKEIETFLPIILFASLITFFGTTVRHIDFAKISFFAGAVLAAFICLTVATYKNFTEPERIVNNWNYLDTQKFYAENPIDPINWGFFLYTEFSESIRFHPIYLGVYYVVAIAFGFSFLSKHLPKWAKALVVVGVGFLTTQLFLLSGKMPILILLVVLIVLAIRMLRGRASRIIKIIIPGLLILIFLIIASMPVIVFRLKATFNTVMNQVMNERETADTANRIYLWKTSWSVMKKKLKTGHGLYGARQVLEESYACENLDYSNSHNQYLMLVLTTGLFGLLFFIACYGVQISAAIRLPDQTYLAFLIVIALAMLTENMLSRHKGIILYSFFNTLFFIHYGIRSRKTEAL